MHLLKAILKDLIYKYLWLKSDLQIFSCHKNLLMSITNPLRVNGFFIFFQNGDTQTLRMQPTRLKMLRTQKMKSNTFWPQEHLWPDWHKYNRCKGRHGSCSLSLPPTFWRTQAIRLHLPFCCSRYKTQDLQVFLQQGTFIMGSLITKVIIHCRGSDPRHRTDHRLTQQRPLIC